MCLSEHLIESFDAMYNEASKMSKGKKVLVSFQTLLKDVPNFSNSMIKQHTDAIIDRCSYFSDLLAAVFVASTKIMSSVRLRQDTAKISLKLPTNDIFIHTVFIEAAKNLYADPYVFHDDGPSTNVTKSYDRVSASPSSELSNRSSLLRRSWRRT